MAKSRAEIQKAYRERQKLKKGQAFLKKETARVKKYYIKTADLNKRAKKQHLKNNKTLRAFRERQKQKNEAGKN